MDSDGTLWVSLPVGWMDGMAVGLRRVGRKISRPRLVKDLSLVKAYAKSYGTRPPTGLSKRQVDLGSGLAKEHAEFAVPASAPENPPAPQPQPQRLHRAQRARNEPRRAF